MLATCRQLIEIIFRGSYMRIIPQHVSGHVRDTCMKLLGISKCRFYMLVTIRKCFRINNVSFSSAMVVLRITMGTATDRNPEALWARNPQTVSKRSSRASWPGVPDKESKRCHNLRDTPSTAGTKKPGSERPSPEPLLKKRGVPSRTGGERILEMLWKPQMP